MACIYLHTKVGHLQAVEDGEEVEQENVFWSIQLLPEGAIVHTGERVAVVCAAAVVVGHGLPRVAAHRGHQVHHDLSNAQVL